MRLRTEIPCFIPEDKEDRYNIPSRLKRDLVGYVPDGYTAEDVIAGRVPQEPVGENALPAYTPETGKKRKTTLPPQVAEYFEGVQAEKAAKKGK